MADIVRVADVVLGQLIEVGDRGRADRMGRELGRFLRIPQRVPDQVVDRRVERQRQIAVAEFEPVGPRRRLLDERIQRRDVGTPRDVGLIQAELGHQERGEQHDADDEAPGPAPWRLAHRREADDRQPGNPEQRSPKDPLTAVGVDRDEHEPEPGGQHEAPRARSAHVASQADQREGHEDQQPRRESVRAVPDDREAREAGRRRRARRFEVGQVAKRRERDEARQRLRVECGPQACRNQHRGRGPGRPDQPD